MRRSRRFRNLCGSQLYYPLSTCRAIFHCAPPPSKNVFNDSSISIIALSKKFEMIRRPQVHVACHKGHLDALKVSQKQNLIGLLLDSLKNKAGGRFQFFSDENFYFDAKMNRRNGRWFAHDAVHGLLVGRSKIFVQISCYTCGVHCSVMPLYFFQEDIRIAGEADLHVLRTVVCLSMTEVSKGP